MTKHECRMTKHETVANASLHSYKFSRAICCCGRSKGRADSFALGCLRCRRLFLFEGELRCLCWGQFGVGRRHDLDTGNGEVIGERNPKGHAKADHGGDRHELPSGPRGRKRLFQKHRRENRLNENDKRFVEGALGRDGPVRPKRGSELSYASTRPPPIKHFPATSNYKVAA